MLAGRRFPPPPPPSPLFAGAGCEFGAAAGCMKMGWEEGRGCWGAGVGDRDLDLDRCSVRRPGRQGDLDRERVEEGARSCTAREGLPTLPVVRLRVGLRLVCF